MRFFSTPIPAGSAARAATVVALSTLNLGAAQSAADHVQMRLGYGPSAESEDFIQAAGIEAWIDANLDATLGPDSLRLTDLLAAIDASSVGPIPDPSDQSHGSNAVVAAILLAHALYSGNQLVETATRFWHTHLTVKSGSMRLYFEKNKKEPGTLANAHKGYFTWLEDDTFRTLALGSFYDLLEASAFGVPMMVYLDTARSDAINPNENYGRELLELHTLGVGNFCEADVHNAAKLFTGFTIRRLPAGQYGVLDATPLEEIDVYMLGDFTLDGATDFDDILHVLANWGPSEQDIDNDGMIGFQELLAVTSNQDPQHWVWSPWFDTADYYEGTKTFYLTGPGPDCTGAPTFVIDPPKNPTHAEMVDEAKSFLQHLALHPSTAAFVSAKFIEWYVYPIDPDADPTSWPQEIQDLRDACVATWLSSGGHVRDVLEVIFSSDVFLQSDLARFAKRETPLESAVSVVRRLEGADPTSGLIQTYDQLFDLWKGVDGVQSLFDYPSPEGYSETPTDSLIERLTLNEKLFLDGLLPSTWIDPLPQDLTVLSQTLLKLFYPGNYDAEDLQTVADFTNLNALDFETEVRRVANLVASFTQGFRQ